MDAKELHIVSRRRMRDGSVESKVLVIASVVVCTNVVICLLLLGVESGGTMS